MTIITTKLDEKINELKKTSEAYAKWQSSLALRDRIYAEIGPAGSAVDRVRELIKYWNAQWQDELASVDPQVSDSTLEALEEMELGMELHQAGRE